MRHSSVCTLLHLIRWLHCDAYCCQILHRLVRVCTNYLSLDLWNLRESFYLVTKSDFWLWISWWRLLLRGLFKGRIRRTHSAFLAWLLLLTQQMTVPWFRSIFLAFRLWAFLLILVVLQSSAYRLTHRKRLDWKRLQCSSLRRRENHVISLPWARSYLHLLDTQKFK